MRTRAMLLAIPIAGVLMLATAHTSAKADTERHFKWYGVWGFPDCYWDCDPVAAGCLTDPDCKCDCFR